MPDKTTRHAQIVSDGQTTHVMVPAAEYERLIAAAEERALDDALRIANDPKSEWVEGEPVLREVRQRILHIELTRARKARGLTQRALGEKLGVPQSQISRIERHPERSSLAMLQRIAAALNMDLRQLI